MRVLIVEDEPMLCHSFDDELSSLSALSQAVRVAGQIACAPSA